MIFSFAGDVLAPQVNVVVRRDRDESTLSLGGTCAGGVPTTAHLPGMTGEWNIIVLPSGAQLAYKRSAVDNAC